MNAKKAKLLRKLAAEVAGDTEKNSRQYARAYHALKRTYVESPKDVRAELAKSLRSEA